MQEEGRSRARRSISEIQEDIGRIKKEIEEEYCLLGKTVCEIAEQDAGKIGKLVDRLVELKNELGTQNSGKREKNEH